MQHISGRKIRWGIVGCGRISINHVKALQAFADDVEIVSLCEVDRSRATQASEMTKARAVHDIVDMLDSDLDVVSLCTPSGIHAQQAIFFAENRIHVVTEKPMATEWTDGLAMVRACEKSGVELFVVKQNRLNAPLQRLKKAVDDGRFGKIYDISINVFWTRGQDYYDQAPWRGTRKMDGGSLMNQASHYVDLLTWLGGPLEQVYASTATLARNIECEDTAVMTLKWRSGAMGTMNVTMLTYPSNLEGSVTVLGEKGTVRIGGLAVNKIEAWKFLDTRPEDADVFEASYETESVYGFGHTGYYKNVIDCLRGKDMPMVGGQEGLHSLETLIAAYQSARSNRPVKLPLER